eukprot:s2018_g15.t1
MVKDRKTVEKVPAAKARSLGTAKAAAAKASSTATGKAAGKLKAQPPGKKGPCTEIAKLEEGETTLSVASTAAPSSRGSAPSSRASSAKAVLREVSFPANENGQPVGILCIKHKKLRCRLCPDEADEVVVDRVNSSKPYKTIFFDAEKMLDALDEHRVIPGCLVYWEAGLLTESEFTDVFGISVKDVQNLKKIEGFNEEGEKRNFYLVNLKGLSAEEVFGMRRIMITHEMAVNQSEFQLLSGEQLTDDQGHKWFSFASKGHFDNARPFKLSGKASLITGGSLHQLARELAESREEALQPDSQDPSENNADLLDEMDGDDGEAGGEPGPKHEVMADPGHMLGRTAMPAPERPKKRRKMDKIEDDEIPEEAGSTMSSQLAHLEAVDPLMFDVAKKHHKITNRPTPPCLLMLSVAKQFQGDSKIGHILNGANKVLDILQENKAREDAVTLQNRIAQIEAVKMLLTKRVDTFKEGDITKILGLLHDHKSDIPLDLKCGLTGRMLDFKFDFIITNASVPRPLMSLAIFPSPPMIFLVLVSTGRIRPYQSDEAALVCLFSHLVVCLCFFLWSLVHSQEGTTSEWKPLLQDSLAAFFVWAVDASNAPQLLDTKDPSFYQVALEIVEQETSEEGDELDALMGSMDGDQETGDVQEKGDKETAGKWKAGRD